MKYHINQKVYDVYGATPKLCVLDSVHFFEFNSKKSEDANFICFASNKAIIEMALKKAKVYGIPLTYEQAKTCLKNCKSSGELVKILNCGAKGDAPLCPLTNSKYVWMTTIRADKTQEELDILKNKKKRAPFEVRRPKLVAYRDRFTRVLADRGIDVIGKDRQIEIQIEKVLKRIEGSSSEERLEEKSPFFNGYIEFLESESYKYQLANNKFTPRLTKIGDISEKMMKIYNFCRNKASWYDPSKHLKEKF